MAIELIRADGEPVALRIDGNDFTCEEETYQTTIPKKFLAGIRLSEIPDEISLKPVESIKGNMIDLNHDIELSTFRDGEDRDNDSLVKKADARLYRAKEEGRNRVVGAD
jgi:GGDEF domain-containing protein